MDYSFHYHDDELGEGENVVVATNGDPLFDDSDSSECWSAAVCEVTNTTTTMTPGQEKQQQHTNTMTATMPPGQEKTATT